jgi:hypothetical protein
MIVRDRDVLMEVTRAAGCRVYMSVPTVDEEAWRILEPGTAHPQQRLRAVRELVDAGIDAGVLMAPIVPGFSSARVWVTDRTPIILKPARDPLDLPHTLEPPACGSVCRVVTFPPE